MTLDEFVALLRLTGYPVAHSHFRVDENNPPPSPPFITYTTGDDGFNADNKNYHKIIDVDIELYTDKKNLQAEQAIESLLDEHELPYEAYQVWIESEQLFQKTYEVRLI